jgi:hypothetical protein
MDTDYSFGFASVCLEPAVTGNIPAAPKPLA